MINEAKQNRLTYIDIAKGILIILVVLGHILTGNHFITKVMIRVINSFHMPAFFIISGLLTNTVKLKEQPFGSFLKKKTVRLLVPYVVFELVGAVWQMILLGIRHPDIAEVFRNILTVRCYVGADWFLIALFFAEMLLYWINRYADEKRFVLAAVICFLLAFYLVETNWLMANCRRIFASLGFILLGIQWKTYFLHDSKLCFVLCTVGLFVGSAVNSGTPSIGLRLFENPLLFVSCGFFGGYVALFASRIVAGWDRIGWILEQCGKASLVIMGTHLNVVIIFNVLYGTWTSVMMKLLILFLVIFVEIPLILFCRRFVPAWVSETRRK